jgi:hypothetical protein
VRLARILFLSFGGLIASLPPIGAFAGPANCRSPEVGTVGAPVVSPPRSALVVGTGRLQFYSAPDPRCPITGTFIIPKDDVILYAQRDDGWAFAGYFHAKDEGFVSGWVRSVRLKIGGTMGATQ